MFRRILALLLCLFLLPVGALANSHPSAPAARFRLTFEMNPEAYPEELQAYMPGIADLLHALTLEGQLAVDSGAFELKTDVLLGGIERTRTNLRLFSTESLWHIQSSLLGRETLTLDMRAFLEFAVKCYSHLGIPLQRVAILATPFVHTLPFQAIYRRFTDTFYYESGTHNLTWSDMIYMGNIIRMLAEDNMPLTMWTRAMAMETGYESYLYDLVYNLPDWLLTFIPETTGLTVTMDETSETWTTNGLTIFHRETDLSGGLSLTFAPPPLPDGNVLTLDAAAQPDGDLLHGSFHLLLGSEEETLLDLRLSGSLPTQLPVTRAFSLDWDAEGLIVGGEGVHLRFEGEATGSGVILRQRTADRSAVMLTITAELEPMKADFSTDVEGESVYILSVNAETLSELMDRIASPMIRGLLPLIAQAPTSSCQTLMNLMEDSGVFALLTEGFVSEDEYWDDEWDWDEY